jgi:hypothetical protein
LLKRAKLVIAVGAAMAIVPVNALPAFAQGQAECGSGANVSRFTLKDIEEGNRNGGGEFASFAAQNIEPSLGQALKPGATKCAQD